MRCVGIAGQTSRVAEPSLGDKGQVQEDGGDDTPGDEEGLEAEGANVGNVGDVLVGGH